MTLMYTQARMRTQAPSILRIVVVAVVTIAVGSSAIAQDVSTLDSSIRALPSCAADFVSARIASDVWLSDVCGGLFRSSDGGKLWQSVPTNRRPASQVSRGRLVALLWLSESTGLIVTKAGEVARTADGGRSWRKQSLPIHGPVLVGARVEDHFWFCNADSELSRSDDAGATWFALPQLPFRRGCGSLTFADTNVGWVAPSAGDRAQWAADRRRGYEATKAALPELWRTSDGGRHWSKAPALKAKPDSMAVFLESPKLGWLFGLTGPSTSVFVTADGGDHWSQSDIPNFFEQTLYFSRSTHWSSQFDTADVVAKRTMVPWGPDWQPIPDTPRMEAPNRSIVLAEGATAVDENHMLVVQRKLLRSFVGNERVETLPLVTKGRGGPEELIGVADGTDLERWAWSRAHIYRAADAMSRWYAVLDAPEPIDQVIHPRFDRVLVRTASGHIRRVQGGPPEWRLTDDPDDVMDWDNATDPPGQHLSTLACLQSATDAELIVRIRERGCFHSREGRVRISWRGDATNIDADLTGFREAHTTGTLSASDARAFANTVQAAAQTGSSLCGGTTYHQLSVYWRCGNGQAQATHSGDRCGSVTAPQSGTNTILDAIRQLLPKVR